MEAIILAGGLGTRLRSVVSELPKCLAPVQGKPFLFYVLSYLEKQKINHIILSLGYKYELILDWIATQNFSFEISYVIEDEPLGTGGAIKLALTKSKENQIFILNGDTFFNVSLEEMSYLNQETGKSKLALKYLTDFDRYGSVTLDDENIITSFLEKQPLKSGWINGGIYLIDKLQLQLEKYPEKFSFEKDVFEKIVFEKALIGYQSNGFFIDIGIPEDYEKAQNINFLNL